VGNSFAKVYPISIWSLFFLISALFSGSGVLVVASFKALKIASFCHFFISFYVMYNIETLGF
jgi:hypothetical protein